MKINLTTRLAGSVEDVNSAFRLINSEFAIRSERGCAADVHEREFFLFWKNPEFCGLKDIVILEVNRTIAGAAVLISKNQRLCPGRRERISSVTFISHITIRDEFRGNGLSKSLINFCEKLSKDRGSEFAIVIARKAVDYYYLKLGFHGMSSYSTLTISPTGNQKDVNLRKASDADCQYLEEAYNKSYRKCVGSCVRSLSTWQFLVNLSSSRFSSNRILVIRESSDNPIGYLCLGVGDRVEEIGMTTTEDPYKVLVGISRFLDKETLTLSIDRDHEMTKHLWARDFTISRRQCIYGGHMIKDLLNSRRNKTVASVKVSDTLSNETGASIITPEGTWRHNAFNIPLLDQI